jgi:hypothetical protein
MNVKPFGKKPIYLLWRETYLFYSLLLILPVFYLITDFMRSCKP